MVKNEEKEKKEEEEKRSFYAFLDVETETTIDSEFHESKETQYQTFC